MCTNSKDLHPPGRAMRGFVAYDIQRAKKVFLKDTWRVDLEGSKTDWDLSDRPVKKARGIKQSCTR
jgi:hypothetical protein